MRKIKLLILLLVGFIAQGGQQKQESIKIEFKLLNSTTYLNENNGYEDQFNAVVNFKNLQNRNIRVKSKIEFGHKSGPEAFYIEAYDINCNEIDISTSADYNWLPYLNSSIELVNGETLTDTICSNRIYAFKNVGRYKLRMVYNPNKMKNENLNKASEIVYSNWDTLTVKK